MKRLELNGLISLDRQNKAIETEVLLKSKQDRSKFNKDALAVKELLKLNNSYLRRKRLNEASNLFSKNLSPGAYESRDLPRKL